MSLQEKTVSITAAEGVVRFGRLFLLEMSGDCIHSMNPDGSDHKTIVTVCHVPDGIAVDVQAGHIYWTNMGVPDVGDGTIERADLDGGNRRVIVPRGVTQSPKQIHLDRDSRRLYWCDREGMRVMCVNLDGSQVEIPVETGRGAEAQRDPTLWCVGVTIDPELRKLYWTQKGHPTPARVASSAPEAEVHRRERAAMPESGLSQGS
jgi:DNA-binding beta-propeller fold protein YncE